MLKIYARTKNNFKIVLNFLHPKKYMITWSFDELMPYIEKELEWNKVKKEDVQTIGFQNETEHWSLDIPRGEVA